MENKFLTAKDELSEQEARREQIRTELLRLMEEVLQTSKIHLEDTFLELGGNSLKAVELEWKINKYLKLDLAMEQLFIEITVGELIEILLEADEIDEMEDIVNLPIEPVVRQEYYDTSSAQKRIYTVEMLSQTGVSYNMPFVGSIEGEIDVDRFIQAVQALVNRHETLRTSFDLIQNKVVQRVHDEIQVIVPYREMNEPQEYYIRKFIRKFDLSTAPLFRIELVKIVENNHLLLFDMHHIITDGISMNIFWDELFELYIGNDLPEMRIQYKDFSVWQNNLFASEVMDRQEEYWLDRFQGEIPKLNLPLDYPRPLVQSFAGNEVTFSIGSEYYQRLRQLMLETSSTLYMILLAILNVLLAKYTGQTDILVGSPIAGRRHGDLDRLIGMFVNTLVMRNAPSGEKTFREFVTEVRDHAYSAYDHQDYPFEELVDQLRIPRDLSRNPLFDVMFVLQNQDRLERDFGDLKLSSLANNVSIAKFDLTVSAREVDEEIQLRIEYCTSLFKQETIRRMAGHFMRIVETVVSDFEIPLAQIELITEEEREQILGQFNQPKLDLGWEPTIHQAFEERVLLWPDQIALVLADREITFRELNERANQLARVLREEGITPNQIVGLILPPSIEMFVGILAVLKAGGGYLPIDLTTPQGRISYMLEDCGVEMILVQRDTQVGDFAGQVIRVDDQRVEQQNRADLEVVNQGTDLAYVIYTSGSTGKPKGVLVEHRALINFTAWFQEYYQITPADRGTKYASISFDASVLEIFPFLLAGASIHVIDDQIKYDLHQLNTYFEENQITLSFLPTPVCEQFMMLDNQSLRMLLTGGDKLNSYIQRNYTLVNNYGPTENTVVTTAFVVDDQYRNIPIGKPITNTQVYIMDENGLLQPIGIPGEVWIGGDSLARGYHTRPDLNEERFVLHPYTQERMYKTGDLAKWLPDGNIEFLGRIDQQVKIRGYRIELGEIETELMNLAEIREAVVLDRADGAGQKCLVGYIVADHEVVVEGLKKQLGERLPDYMIPPYFVQVESIPLSTNGKVEKDRLPEPDWSGELESYLAPTNELEAQLISIWCEILSVQKIGILDNFFEIGGHSLKAISLACRIKKEFDVELPLGEFFQVPTVQKMAHFIASSIKQVYTAIELVEEKQYYPVSSAQKRLFILDQLQENSTHYNIPGVLAIEGPLCLTTLENGFQKLVQRHEALRTSFHTIDGELVQKIHQDVEFAIQIQDGSEADVDRLIAEFIQPFDLGQAPLMRVGLIRLPERVLLIYDLHHIISDGVSMNLLIDDFVQLYQGRELAPLRIQYKEFAIWQQDLFESKEMKKQEEFWLERFSREVPVLNLPTDYLRPAVMSNHGSAFSFHIDSKLTAGLKELAKEKGATLYMILLAAYNIFLAKYTGQDDLVVGSPIAGRSHPDLEKVIGMFVNTLAMRNTMDQDSQIGQWVVQVRDQTVQALENQDYPFELLVEKLTLQRDLSRNALFDTMFGMQNMDQPEVMLDDLRFIPLAFKTNTAKFDLELYTAEEEEEIRGTFVYRTELFKPETIERFSKHLLLVIRNMVEDPQLKIRELEMVLPEERIQLVDGFNQTQAEFPAEKTLHQLFLEQVSRTPDQVAALFADQQLTYRQLDEKSNQVARLLREKGVGPDDLVGILLERSLKMIIGIFGIIKAGGAYLPIAPDYPQERIEFILADSQARLLLTEKDLDQITFEGEILNLADVQLDLWATDALPVVNQPTDLAYVIYTSGSTGQPKGVMIEHHSVVNRLNWGQRKYPLTSADLIMQKTPFTFDVSVWELFWWSLVGAKVVFLQPGEEKEPQAIVNAIAEYQVTTIHFVPSMLTTFLSYLKHFPEKIAKLVSLRQVFVSGEALKAAQVRDFHTYLYAAHQTKLINLYGPTETTVEVTYFDCSPDQGLDQIPIGRPIDNTQMYVLDANLQLVPLGVVGELHIGGRGLARGYLNRAELTAEKFIPSPFVPGERIYKTGDLARWLADGNIEYLGRMDGQVKIRGYRIELGEIEARLLEHPLVTETVVMIRKDATGEPMIIAYVVGVEELTMNDLEEYLLARLPEYMVPGYFVQISEMPLTPNGKVNRKALPEVVGQRMTGQEYIAPTNRIEEGLAQIWSQVLGIDSVGITDHFFKLGGHSLKATSLVAKIYKEFGVEIPLRQVFQMPTIREMAGYIAGADKNMYMWIEPVGEQEAYTVSSAQRRLYILNQMAQNQINYNMPGVMYIEGAIDLDAFRGAFVQLVKRHESLRTSFHTVDGEIMQKIHRDVDFNIGYSEGTESEVQELVTAFIQPFDLSQAPLLRVKLVKLPERYLLIFDLHHIIADGISMNLLIEDFVQLYQGHTLSDLRIQPKDVAVWQQRYFASEQFLKQEEYWLEIFSGDIPVLSIATDQKRPPVQNFQGDLIKFMLDQDVTKGLKRLVNESEATLYIVLLAAYNILLAKYAGQEDIIVGTPIAGRSHPDLEKLIGMFVNTLVMRNQPAGEKRVVDFIAEVKDQALKAYENQDYPFEMLIEKLDLKRDLSRNALFDTMFAVQNLDRGEMVSDDLRFIPFDFKTKAAKLDLELYAVESGQGIDFSWVYSTELFTQATMERLSRHFIQIIQGMIDDPNVTLGQIQMITQEEKEQLLGVFNNTQADYPGHKTLIQLFAEQVVRRPEQVAVRFTDRQFTYQDLDEKSNQVARILREKGVTPDDLVAIMLERSPEMVIGIYGILKAGGAYLPIAPEYPDERIGFMLNDSKARLILSADLGEENNSRLTTILQKVDLPCEVLNLSEEEHYFGSMEPVVEVNQPKDLAYVIYTSGSTGRPKGVMIEHQSAVNRLHWMQRKYPLTAQDTILQKTPFTFDVSVWELFWWALVGARVAFLEPGGEKEPQKIIDAIERYKVTTMHFVPSMLTAFLSYLGDFPEQIGKLASLKQVFASGEALQPNQVREFNQNLYEAHGTVLANLYGPTEATVDVTYFDCLPDQDLSLIPIGRPIDNTQIYILDSYQQLQPVGVVGELHLGGIGLARGYLNRSELTEEKFIPNPFVPGERMYKTGDLARWLPDGHIEYLGRMDGQVKIRGYRIELGEIEARLLEHPEIKEAVVVVREDHRNEPYLAAFVVCEIDVDGSQLRKYLLSRLPEYMVPTYLLPIDQMPLSANGKLNRKALPEIPDLRQSAVQYVAPDSVIEEKLAVIWSEILGMEKVSQTDHFFDLGGHSLTAIKLASVILKEFAVEVTLQDIFQFPRMADLAQLIGTREKTLYREIPKALEQEVYELSYAQQRLWIKSQLDPDSMAYNMPFRVHLAEKVNPELIKEIFAMLVERHESLRTYFLVKDGKVRQCILPKIQLPFRTVDLTEVSQADVEVRRRQIFLEDAQKPFDLQRGPLFRITLVKVGEMEFDLICVLHHIISDGWSMEVLQREFGQSYEGYKLGQEIRFPDLKIQYKDFAAWQGELLRNEKQFTEVLDFWSEQFAKPFTPLQLPYDKPPTEGIDRRSAGYRLVIPIEVKELLQELAIQNQASLFTVLLAGFKVLLGRLTRQTDILIGSPSAGREHESLKDVIGFFVNTIVLRSELNHEMTFAEFVKEIQGKMIQALEYQVYPLEVICTKLKVDYPQISVFFNMLNFHDPSKNQLENVESHHLEEVQDVKFDLNCYLNEYSNGIEVNCHYLKELFAPETIEYMMNEYVQVLKMVAANSEGRLEDYVQIKRKQILF